MDISHKNIFSLEMTEPEIKNLLTIIISYIALQKEADDYIDMYAIRRGLIIAEYLEDEKSIEQLKEFESQATVCYPV